ncbi:MAG TPA: DUF421 domain-containing protein [Limnochordia bacterium]|nr:DUF421 domain-containing protein [Limnochordia bacterium]
MVVSLVWRTALFYILILALMRLLGKREIDQLAPIDLIVMIMIAELAVIPMEDTKMPIMAGIVPILVLGALEFGLAVLSLKSVWWRRAINGQPAVVIRDGRIDENELRRIRWNLDDLMQELRLKSAANILDVEVAMVENNGKLSVIFKSQERAVRPSDLGVATQYEGLDLVLVKDGRVDRQALTTAHLDEDWLRGQLAAQGIHEFDDCLLAVLDSTGRLFVQARHGARAPLAYVTTK